MTSSHAESPRPADAPLPPIYFINMGSGGATPHGSVHISSNQSRINTNCDRLSMNTYHGEEAASVVVEKGEDELRPRLQRPLHEVRHTQEELVRSLRGTHAHKRPSTSRCVCTTFHNASGIGLWKPGFDSRWDPVYSSFRISSERSNERFRCIPWN